MVMCGTGCAKAAELGSSVESDEDDDDGANDEVGCGAREDAAETMAAMPGGVEPRCLAPDEAFALTAAGAGTTGAECAGVAGIKPGGGKRCNIPAGNLRNDNCAAQFEEASLSGARLLEPNLWSATALSF